MEGLAGKRRGGGKGFSRMVTTVSRLANWVQRAYAIWGFLGKLWDDVGKNPVKTPELMAS